jgi:hypothetical protein
MKFIKVLIILLSVFFFSCTKENGIITSNSLFETPIVLGYKLIDINASPLGVVGQPNVKTEISNSGIRYKIVVYPIPAYNFIELIIDAPKDGNQRKIWVKPARISGSFPDNYYFGTLNMNASASVYQVTTTENRISIDVAQFPKGYYRLYLMVADQILYENIVITK